MTIPEQFLVKKGADDRIRTGDLLITNELLYQLSYIGVEGDKISTKPSPWQAPHLASSTQGTHNYQLIMEALLRLLQQDSTTPRPELARQLNLTPEEIDARIASMEKDGVIVGYQAIVDKERLDKNTVTALIEVRITPERGGGFDRVAQRVAKFEQVVSCYLMSGGYDLIVVVQGGSLREVASFVSEKLSTLDAVISTATHFRLKSYKENGAMLVPEVPAERLVVTP